MVPDMFRSAPLPKWVSVLFWILFWGFVASGLIGIVRGVLWVWSKAHVTFG